MAKLTLQQRRGPNYHLLLEEIDDDTTNDVVIEVENEDEDEDEDELNVINANEPDLDATTVSDTLLRRIVRNLINQEDKENGQKKAYIQATTENLAKICDMLQIDYVDLDLARTQVLKQIIFNRIISFVRVRLNSFQQC